MRRMSVLPLVRGKTAWFWRRFAGIVAASVMLSLSAACTSDDLAQGDRCGVGAESVEELFDTLAADLADGDRHGICSLVPETWVIDQPEFEHLADQFAGNRGVNVAVSNSIGPMVEYSVTDDAGRSLGTVRTLKSDNGRFRALVGSAPPSDSPSDTERPTVVERPAITDD